METLTACARGHETWCNNRSGIGCNGPHPAHFIWEQISISVLFHHWQHTKGHPLKALLLRASPPCISTFNETQVNIMLGFLAADSYKPFPFLFGPHFSTTRGCEYSRYCDVRWVRNMAMATSNTCHLYW